MPTFKARWAWLQRRSKKQTSHLPSSPAKGSSSSGEHPEMQKAQTSTYGDVVLAMMSLLLNMFTSIYIFVSVLIECGFTWLSLMKSYQEISEI